MNKLLESASCLNCDYLQKDVTASPPYGKWEIYNDCEGKNTKYTCPFCGHKRETFAYIPKFCEECGADMRG